MRQATEVETQICIFPSGWTQKLNWQAQYLKELVFANSDSSDLIVSVVLFSGTSSTSPSLSTSRPASLSKLAMELVSPCNLDALDGVLRKLMLSSSRFPANIFVPTFHSWRTCFSLRVEIAGTKIQFVFSLSSFWAFEWNNKSNLRESWRVELAIIFWRTGVNWPWVHSRSAADSSSAKPPWCSPAAPASVPFASPCKSPVQMKGWQMGKCVWQASAKNNAVLFFWVFLRKDHNTYNGYFVQQEFHKFAELWYRHCVICKISPVFVWPATCTRCLESSWQKVPNKIWFKGTEQQICCFDNFSWHGFVVLAWRWRFLVLRGSRNLQLWADAHGWTVSAAITCWVTNRDD